MALFTHQSIANSTYVPTTPSLVDLEQVNKTLLLDIFRKHKFSGKESVFSPSDKKIIWTILSSKADKKLWGRTERNFNRGCEVKSRGRFLIVAFRFCSIAVCL